MSFTPIYEFELLDYGVSGWDAILSTDFERLDNILDDIQGQINTISGSDVVALTDLADCPSTYDDGKYLRSTSSGTEWATVSGGSGGTTDHALLTNLDYADSGHTGFQPAGDYITETEMTTISGNIVEQIPTDFYTTAEVDTISGTLQTEIDNLDNEIDTVSGTLQGDIDGKAALVHTHTAASVYLHDEQTLDAYINHSSAGKISGFTITSGTAASTINIEAGTCYIKETNTALGDIHYFSVDAVTGLAIVEDEVNYIYVDYNSGSPIVSGTITKTDMDNRTKVSLGRVFFSDSEYHIINAGMDVTETAKAVQSRLNSTDGDIVRASGLIISATGTRNIAITAGVVYAGLTRGTTSAQDTSGADTFSYFYRDGGTGWTKVAAQTQIDNTHYDDGTGTLATLTSNRYGVHWVYSDFDDSHLLVVYGRGDYTLAGAQAATPPEDLPLQASEFSFIAGRIIIQKSATSFYSIESAFTNEFNTAGITDHGNLSGLEDDDHTQYHNDTRGDARYYTQSQITTYLADKYDKTGGYITGNVTIQGNLTVTGTEFISHVEEVEVDDNLLLINANETGGGVTKGWAGIEVDRGTENNYQFFFVEADDNFQVGISGSTQPVATRKDSADMDDTFVPYWNAADYRFQTDNSIAYTAIATTTNLATVSGALNSKIEDKLTDVVDDTSPELGGDLSLNEHSITLNSSPSSDHTANGDIASMTVDANSTGFGAALHMDTDGHWIEADADADTTMPCAAIALETGTGTKKVLLRGFIRDDTWNWTIGGVIYVSTTVGGLTQTAPSGSGDQVQVVGFAVSADVMYFSPALVTAEVA